MVLRRTLSISKVPSEPQDKEEVVKFKAVVRDVFSHLDKHKKGYLTREAVCDGLKNLELPSRQDHVEDLFSVFDVNQDGIIHYAQFETLAMHRRAQLADVFDALDHTADGFIREEDIRRALDKLDIAASDAQILKLLNRADLDHDGKISLKEFQHFLILCTSASVAEVFDYWAHASAIDIGESMAAPDNFETRAQAVVTFVAGAIAGVVSRTATAPFDRLKTLLQVARISSRGYAMNRMHMPTRSCLFGYGVPLLHGEGCVLRRMAVTVAVTVAVGVLVAASKPICVRRVAYSSVPSLRVREQGSKEV